MKVSNRIPDVSRVYPFGNMRDVNSIRHLVLHRNSVKTKAVDFARWFRDEGHEWTGSKKMSYHFVVRKDGVIEQAVPLDRIAPAAKGMNSTGIQVCVVGDFTQKKPTKAQVASVTELLFRLRRAFPKAEVVGHSPSKPCPGPLFPLEAVKREVEEMAETQGRALLKLIGIVV